MVFFCGSTHTKSEIHQKDYGDCVKSQCDGRANLMNEKSQKFLFCCIRRPLEEYQTVECTKCGASVKLKYYGVAMEQKEAETNKYDPKNNTTPVDPAAPSDEMRPEAPVESSEASD